LPILYDETGREGRIIALVLDEIRSLPVLPLALPMPRERRLALICAAMRAARARWAGVGGTWSFSQPVGCQNSAWPVSCSDAPAPTAGHDDRPCPSACSI